MIVYDKLWETLKVKNISQYDLYNIDGISKSLLNRLRQNKNVEMVSIERICKALSCDIGDIASYIDDDTYMERINTPIEDE